MSETVTFQIAISRDGTGSSWDRREVPGHVHGAWGAHEAYGIGGVYRVTHLAYGLAAPFTFPTLKTASAAASEIDAMREDWRDLSAQQIKELAPSIVRICESWGGERSSLGPTPDMPYPSFRKGGRMIPRSAPSPLVGLVPCGVVASSFASVRSVRLPVSDERRAGTVGNVRKVIGEIQNA